MLLRVEPDSVVPIYLQLRNQIVTALVRGELIPNEKLPSVRQLARDLGINLHTVNKAYKLLEDEGYLKVVKRRGAIIGEPPVYDQPYLNQLETELHALYIEARSHGVSASLFMRTTQKVTETSADPAQTVSDCRSAVSLVQEPETSGSSAQKGAR